MSTDLQLDTKGLDQLKRSTLTISDLLRHFVTAKKILLLDTPFHEIGAAPTRLTIRVDGTYVVLPERRTPLEQTLPATAALLDAMANFAVNPSDESAAELKRAKNQFDPMSLRCVQHAIRAACLSREFEFQANLEGTTISFRLPHRAMLPKRPHPETTASKNGDDDTIRTIRRFVDAISNSGMAALIRRDRGTPNIKAGDRIMLKMTKNSKRYFKLRDAVRDQDLPATREKTE